MKLTKARKLDFIKQGFIKIPRAVPREKIDAALRVINRELGEKRRSDLTPEHVPYFSALFHSPELMGLLTETPLWPIVESLIGAGQVEMPQAEVTLGFPNPNASVMFNGKELHIDGFPDKGRYQETFTLNAGIFLSDVPGPCMGNFKVVPGSHETVAELARARGHADIGTAVSAGHYPRTKQLTVNAGDAVLCHFNLVHAREWNSTPAIRYAVFFRIKRIGHLQNWQSALGDLWSEWDGVKSLVSAPSFSPSPLATPDSADRRRVD